MGKDVQGLIGYARDTGKRPYFYANAHEKDYVPLAPVEMTIHDARGLPTSLDREGFVLARHSSTVADLTDLDTVARIHAGEIAGLLKALTGADLVKVGPRGILRFSERSDRLGKSDNSHPARFAHVDIARQTAAVWRERDAPEGAAVLRSAHYNVWRVLSEPPQDVPLALCAWPSMGWDDLIEGDAIFDPPDGSPEWSFENYVIRHNPAHRWHYYPDLTVDEAIVFKTSDSDPDAAQCMPHGAFDNPLAGPDTPPRISLEMRGTAYWLA